MACQRGRQTTSDPRACPAALESCGGEAQDQARRSRLAAGSGDGALSAGRGSEGTRRSSARDREGPGSHPRQAVPGHRPGPAGPEARGPGRTDEFQKEAVPESSKLCPGRRGGGGAGRGGGRRRSRPWRQRSGNSPRIPTCTTTPPVPFPWRREPSPGRTRRRDVNSPSDAFSLLREAVQDGDADFGRMDEDADLDPIRDDPAFAEIMKAGHPDRRYAAVWSSDATSFEAIPVYGLDPAAHLRRCRELAAQGYRPVVVVGGTDHSRRTAGRRLGLAPPRGRRKRRRTDWPSGRRGRRSPWFAWARPRRSGPSCGTVPTPGSAASSSTGSNPLGADPRTIAAELDRIDPDAKPTPAPGPADDGRHPVPPRDIDAAGVDPGAGDIRDGGSIPRRAGAADRQAPRPLPQRPRRRHPRGGGMDPAAVEAAGEARWRSMPS